MRHGPIATFILILILSSVSFANTPLRTSRARITPGFQSQSVELQSGGSLTLVSTAKWISLSEKISEEIDYSHRRYKQLLGDIPTLSVSVGLLDEELFFKTTKAPRWINALFFEGKILIPVPENGKIELDNLCKSLRHEFSHIVIASVSGGRAPGWLDEGLAQWTEGEPAMVLKQLLSRHLDRHQPLPFSMLQGGFTEIRTDLVGAAYGQSLFATLTIMQTFGLNKLSLYLKKLRLAEEPRKVFQESFGISIEAFELELGKSLKRWNMAFKGDLHESLPFR